MANIVFFDLETTGKKHAVTRIVQICAIKVDENMNELARIEYMVNPLIPIEPDATAINGITNEDVKDCPTFSDIAQEVYDFIQGCGLGGYNCVRFDIPVLYLEFLRAGITWNWKNVEVYDVYLNYVKHNSTKLSDVYKRYFGKPLDDAHNACADIQATLDIYKRQISDGEPIESEEDKNQMNSYADVSGAFRIRRNQAGNRELYISFGKWEGVSVDKVDPGYFKWMANSEQYGIDTQSIARKLYDKYRID